MDTQNSELLVGLFKGFMLCEGVVISLSSQELHRQSFNDMVPIVRGAAR